MDAALGQFFEFDPTVAIGRFDALGEAEVVVPVTMYNNLGHPVEMTITLTTNTSTAVMGGDQIALTGRPLGADGRAELVGVLEFPDSSAFSGDVMRMTLDVHLEK